MATIDTIKEILANNCDINPDDVTPEATLESLDIDSLEMVELICDLEDQLGIEFGEPEGLDTIGAIVDYIEEL